MKLSEGLHETEKNAEIWKWTKIVYEVRMYGASSVFQRCVGLWTH
jgi:hypothetical protein